MELAPRSKAILIMVAGVAFVALGLYQVIVPNAWGGGGQWITDGDGNSEYVIGELTPEQKNDVLRAENAELMKKIDDLQRQLGQMILVTLEQLKVISQLVGVS